MQAPEMKEKLKAQELEPMVMDGKALGDFIKAEQPYWSSFIKQSGIKAAD
jgi:tripartite-type tricarboxylate transporter receptor subunit TctC